MQLGIIKLLIIFFKNMYYFPKTGILFTLIFLITTAYLDSISGGVPSNVIYLTSFLIFIICYGVPINIIGFVVTKQRKKREILENNLGLRLVRESKGIKEQNEIEDYNRKNKNYLEFVKHHIINKLIKENKNSPKKLNEISKEIYNLEEEENKKKVLTNEITQKYPFVKKLKEFQNKNK